MIVDDDPTIRDLPIMRRYRRNVIIARLIVVGGPLVLLAGALALLWLVGA